MAPLKPAPPLLPEAERHGAGLIFGAFFLYLVGALLRSVLAELSLPGEIAYQVYLGLLILGLVMFFGARAVAGGADVLGLGDPVRGCLRGFLTYLAAVGPILLITYLYKTYVLSPEQAGERQSSALQLQEMDGFFEVFLIGCALTFVVPLFEEVLFRGWLQNGLGGILRVAMSPRSADVTSVLLTATLFALTHKPVTWLVVFIIGLVVGTLYVRTRSFWAVFTFHATHNAFTVIYLRLWD